MYNNGNDKTRSLVTMVHDLSQSHLTLKNEKTSISL